MRVTKSALLASALAFAIAIAHSICYILPMPPTPGGQQERQDGTESSTHASTMAHT